MKIDERIYYYRNGGMKLLSSTKTVFKISTIEKPIRKWYRHNPYSKRLNEEWICGDYRIDQQRPQRKVYSECYLRIFDMSEMEKNFIDKLIKDIEKDIEYPTVWDDGENRYYEKTIYCPNCGKRRKVLTSKTHCEFCGFKFSEAIECKKCGALNLKDSNVCIKCGNDFRVKEVKKEDNIVYEEIVRCPKCGSVKSEENHKCRCCDFDFDSKKECVNCHSWVDENDNFCNNCGQKLGMFKICKCCGKKNDGKYSFCGRCGNKL